MNTQSRTAYQSTPYFFELLELNYICFLASYSLRSLPILYGSVENDSQFIVNMSVQKSRLYIFLITGGSGFVVLLVLATRKVA